MEFALLLIFWYGILHAFGPDHLMAIADFSIGKSKRKTMIITLSFAFGHGVMLFIFAKLLEYIPISDHILEYGNIISSLVILTMGLFILFMLSTHRIQLKTHTHEGKEHIHIWYGKEHQHSDDNSGTFGAFSIGALMGIGGVRGMLVTLALLGSQSVDLMMILMFVLGVSVVFVSLGFVILYINQNLLNNIQNVRKVFASVGVLSVIVGTTMLFTPHSHAMMSPPDMFGFENHTHTINNADDLVASKERSDMSYRQMMQQMGEAYKMIQTGIMDQNKELVKMGVWMIENHPAPKEKPWSIVKEKDKESFKQTLIAYDTLLHTSSYEINEALADEDWIEINKKVFELSNHCISCHQIWKNNLK